MKLTAHERKAIPSLAPPTINVPTLTRAQVARRAASMRWYGKYHQKPEHLTVRRRIEWYGWNTDEAKAVPPGMPLWMWRIEQREGRSMKDLLTEYADTNAATVYEIAKAWNVEYATLGAWARKWGVKFKRGSSPWLKPYQFRAKERTS